MHSSIRVHGRAVILQFAMSFIISGPNNTVANLKHAALMPFFQDRSWSHSYSQALLHHHCRSQSQALPDIRLDPALKLRPSLSPHSRSIHIGRALVVWLSDHAHDTDQDLFHTLNRTPALGSLLVVVGVVAGRVKDRYADNAVSVDCGIVSMTLHLRSSNV